MTENNDTPTTASQETAERTSSNESPRSQTNAAVTLEVTPYREEDAETLRQALPSADVRVEVVGRQRDPDRNWVDTIRPVFRCTYSSLPQALDAKRLLAPGVATHVHVTTDLDEQQLVFLACYHIHSFLQADRRIHFLAHRGENPAYVPGSYDELPWPGEFIEGPSECRDVQRELQRLEALESILGIERVRRLYDFIATHPHPTAMSDGEFESHYGGEEAWGTYQEGMAARRAAEAESDVDVHDAEDRT